MRRVIGLIALLVALWALPASSADAPTGEVVSFTAPDGVALSGVWYGSGKSVVVLSHMHAAGQQGWAPLIGPLLDAGYAVFTYNFRGNPPSGGLESKAILEDLLAAVELARGRGATHLALVGASMGAIATVLEAEKTGAKAYVALSLPRSFVGLTVTDAALQSPIPKLFVYAEDDDALTKPAAMVEAAAVPKESQVYEGGLHGQLLLLVRQDPPLTGRIVAFLTAAMPPA